MVDLRIRLLIDVMMNDEGIARLQSMLGEQPITAVLIEGYPRGLDGRFMGATMVEKEESDARPTG